MSNIADWLQLTQQKAEQQFANEQKLRALCEKNGVDYDAIKGGPRPGAIQQDPLLAEFYDLQEMGAILDSLLAKDEGGAAAVGALEDVEGVTPEIAQQFRDMGLLTPDDVAGSDPKELERARGVGKAKARQIKEAAHGAATPQAV